MMRETKTIQYRAGYKYQLDMDAHYAVSIYPVKPIKTDWLNLTMDGVLTISKGYAWDGPSGPTIDSKNTMRGSLVHDALYQLIRAGLLPKSARLRADMELRRLMREDGMTRFRAWVYFKGVRRCGGLHNRLPDRHKLKTAP